MKAFSHALLVAGALAFGGGAAAAQTVTVGSKNFTEQFLIAEMTAQLLESRGFTVRRQTGLGTTVLRQAQENGQVDIYWEYTGTSLVVFNRINERLDPDTTYNRVRELDAAKGLVWLNRSRANNTYALAMNPDVAQRHGIRTLSDLARVVRGGTALNFAVNAEFPGRQDGLIGLQEMYDFRFARPNLRSMDSGLTYQALRDRQVDIGLVFATDGRIAAFNFLVLGDDRGFFTSYNLTPVVRRATLDAHPQIAELLNPLSALLDDATMQRLNASVDVERKEVRDVAAEFLRSNNLLR
jgi:osmoprotectant transport system substrate-binding protein